MQLGPFHFNRMEFAGSLGDLGTLLPIAMGLSMVNGFPLQGIFLSAGLFYILGGMYYRVPIAVQPMKAIGAYSIALALDPAVIQAAGLWMAVILLAVGLTGFINVIARLIPLPVIRGVQASTGTILAVKGLQLIAGKAVFQETAGSPEPFLLVQSVGPVPIGVLVGLGFAALALVLLNNKRVPAGLILIFGGMLAGLALGAGTTSPVLLRGAELPPLLPFGLPSLSELTAAFVILVLPQTPMTIGNAVLANADLSNQYFPEGRPRVTPRALCVSMAGANVLALALGGMPMCHGAGGLAAHYRFGARTAGSNLIVGVALVAAALLLGRNAGLVVHLIPMAVLGILLVLAGAQLSLTTLDVRTRNDMFVVFIMLAVTLALNLAWAFGIGLALSWLLNTGRIQV